MDKQEFQIRGKIPPTILNRNNLSELEKSIRLRMLLNESDSVKIVADYGTHRKEGASIESVFAEYCANDIESLRMTFSHCDIEAMNWQSIELELTAKSASYAMTGHSEEMLSVAKKLLEDFFRKKRNRLRTIIFAFLIAAWSYMLALIVIQLLQILNLLYFNLLFYNSIPFAIGMAYPLFIVFYFSGFFRIPYTVFDLIPKNSVVHNAIRRIWYFLIFPTILLVTIFILALVYIHIPIQIYWKL